MLISRAPKTYIPCCAWHRLPVPSTPPAYRRLYAPLPALPVPKAVTESFHEAVSQILQSLCFAFLSFFVAIQPSIRGYSSSPPGLSATYPYGVVACHFSCNPPTIIII